MNDEEGEAVTDVDDSKPDRYADAAVV